MASWDTTPAAEIEPDGELAEEILAVFPVVTLLTQLIGSTPVFPLLATPGLEPFALIPSFDTATLRLFDLLQVRANLHWAEARHHATGLDDDELNWAAQLLVASGMAAAVGDQLLLHPSADNLMDTPLPVLRHYWDSINSDAWARAATLLGIDVGTRKDERVGPVLVALNDRDRVRAALAEIPETAELFDALMDAYLNGLSGDEEHHQEPLVVPTDAVDFYRDPPSSNRRDDIYADQSVAVYRLVPGAIHRFPGVGPAGRGHASPLDELADRQLVRSPRYRRFGVGLWAEVWWSTKPPDTVSWKPAPKPALRAPKGETVTPQQVHQQCLDLLDQLRQRPAEGKKSGDRGVPVKYWRTAAKAINVKPETAGLLGVLLLELGLLVAVLIPNKSRARNAKDGVEWQVHPVKAAEFAAADPALNWLRLLDAWLPQQLSDFDRSQDDVYNRYCVLHLLRQIEPGSGAPVGEFLAYARDRFLALGDGGAEQTIKELALLGVINNGPVIGLSPAAVAADGGVDDLTMLLRAGDRTFIVQPDHSIIGGNLAPDIEAKLARIASPESSGGASVWRLDRERVSYTARTESAASLIGFLTEHSRVPVPETVERFITDAAGSLTTVTINPVGCVLTADPETALTVARIKATKLEVVAPGVAVSPLDAGKVADVLAGKGIIVKGLASGSGAASNTSAEPGNIASSDAAIEAELLKRIAPYWVVDQQHPQAPLPVPVAWHHPTPGDHETDMGFD